ncbi:MAG: FtsX-like permease family protein [Bacteroidales bacterium]|nr:FtsX-like permease family protein [Bacteroidales bacterium]
MNHFIKLFIRVFLKNKIHYLIKIFCITLGISCFIVVMQYVNYEMNYDKGYENSENIYRLQLDVYKNGELQIQSAQTVVPLGAEIKKIFPEIITCTRFLKFEKNMLITANNNKFYEDRICFSDPSFFQQFGLELTKGVISEDSEPGVYISEEFAEKYFKDENPLGKNIEFTSFFGTWKWASIVGVFNNDKMEQSHFMMDIVFNMPSMFARSPNWRNNVAYTYVTLNPNTNIEDLEEGITQFLKEKTFDDNEDQIKLQAIRSIHLSSDLDGELEVNGSKQMIQLLLGVCILILLMTWIVYLNIATSISLNRSNEVAIKKIFGVPKRMLISQFVGEAFIVNLIGLFFGILCSIKLAYFFNSYTGILIDKMIWSEIWFFFFIIGIFFIGFLASGILPGILLSHFKPINLLGKKSNQTFKSYKFKELMVIAQIAITIILIVGVLVVNSQINYLRNKKLGFDKENVLVVKFVASANDYINQIESFKKITSEINEIKDVTNINGIPGDELINTSSLYLEENTIDESIQVHKVYIDDNFCNVFKLSFLEGEDFSEDYNLNAQSVIINETCMKRLGFKSPAEAVGQFVMERSRKLSNYKIIGVVQDYNHRYGKFEIQPMILLTWKNSSGFFALKLNEDINTIKTVEYVKTVWTKFFPELPFSYFFFDVYFERQFKDDVQFLRIMKILVAIITILSVIGLFSLSTFYSIKRKKEVCIRWVLGASVTNIIGLFFKDMFKLVAVGSIIAYPLAFWVFTKWLDRFAYHIQITPFILFLAFFVMLIIILVTVLYHIFSVVRMNPVDSLREE